MTLLSDLAAIYAVLIGTTLALGLGGGLCITILNLLGRKK